MTAPTVEGATRLLAEALRAEMRAEATAAPLTPPSLLTIQEAGQRLSLSRNGIYGLMARGELRSVKVGRRRLIPASEIERIAGGARVEGASPATPPHPNNRRFARRAVLPSEPLS